jgi:citrate synthase
MTDKTVTITNNTDSTSFEFPLRDGTIGPPAVDISTLYRDAGFFTFDPGFMATASCDSAITYIDGEKGVLLYRGYPIEQLATKASFLEVAYLLLYGELPNEAQLDFERVITTHTMLNENLKNFLNGFHYDAHPMAILCGVVGSLSAFYHDSIDVNDARYREVSAHRLIAKVPTIAAAAYKHNVGEPIMYPRNDLRYGANFLHMMFATPCADYKPGCWPRRHSTCCSSCTRTMSRTPAPPRCGSGRQLRGESRSPVSPPVSHRSGGRRTAAPTRRCWTC